MRLSEDALLRAPPDVLQEVHERHVALKHEWIRRMVLERGRIDILAREVLGYQVMPHHLMILKHQTSSLRSLVLAPRGSGKSTIGTIAHCIFLVLRNPDVRILIASKSQTNAEVFLKEIKGHFERNETLTTIFGPQYDPRRCAKWDNKEIEVLPRKSNSKEGTITTVGVEGTIVGRHYDAIFPDDLVDEDNTRTSLMRSKTKTWFYKTLDPTLEPPDAKIPERGLMPMTGTRYHSDDFYATMMGEASDGTGGELKDTTLRIPALDDEGRSYWPEKFTPQFLEEKRKGSGVIIFGGQYQQNTDAMKGEIINYDTCQMIEESQVPEGLPTFQGVDLAIGEEETNDKFSEVTIKWDRKRDYFYVVNWFEDRLRFNEQRNKIVDEHDVWDPVRVLVEVVAYQAAQVMEVKRKRPDLRVYGVRQPVDKITKFQKMSGIFDDMRVFFVKTGSMHLLVEQLVLLAPGCDHDDGADALELAIRATRVRVKRKKRKREPGLIGG